MKHRMTLFVVLSVLSSAAWLGCNHGRDTQKSIQFAQIPVTYSATTQVASDHSFYDAEDIKAIIVSVPAGPDVMNALRSRAAGSPVIGGIAITPVASMIGAGDHPIILATTLLSDRRVKLVTFDSSGISEDGNTLKGKRIGIVRNTVGDIYLSRLLEEAQLSQNDVTIANGRPADLKNLLLRGDLDAAILWDPFVVQSVREYRRDVKAGSALDRGKIKVLVEPGLYTLAFNVVTTREKLSGNRDQIKAFLRAVIKAGDYINDNRDTAAAELEHWLALSEDDLKDFVYTTDFRVHLNLPAVENWLKDELVWLKTINDETIIPQDISSYVDGSLLSEIDPSRVAE